MATYEKLPSGSWRVRIVTGYEKIDGKRKVRRESFVARTKRDAERLAEDWKEQHKKVDNINVSVAIDRYISLKESSLSASTVKGYKKMQKNRFSQIADVRIMDLDTPTIQLWISCISADLDPKSVRNAYGLLRSSVRMFRPNFSPVVTLPKKIPKKYDLPEDEDVQKVIAHVQAHKHDELLMALILARHCGLRRSEICALKRSDLHGSVLTIDKALVADHENKWILKQTKTASSTRQVPVPDLVVQLAEGKEGRLVSCTPDALSDRLTRAIKFAKVPKFTFHQLRHLFASKAMLAGIPDVYIEALGGWQHGSQVLKTVYQNATEKEAAAQLQKLWKKDPVTTFVPTKTD